MLGFRLILTVIREILLITKDGYLSLVGLYSSQIEWLFWQFKLILVMYVTDFDLGQRLEKSLDMKTTQVCISIVHVCSCLSTSASIIFLFYMCFCSRTCDLKWFRRVTWSQDVIGACYILWVKSSIGDLWHGFSLVIWPKIWHGS